MDGAFYVIVQLCWCSETCTKRGVGLGGILVTGPGMGLRFWAGRRAEGVSYARVACV